jgi:N-acetylneuraminic acid mutarotase
MILRFRAIAGIAASTFIACASEPRSSTASGDPDASLPEAGFPPTSAWSNRAPLPRPQQEGAVVTLSGKVYVIGGLDNESNPLDVVHVYDHTTNKWAKASPLPKPMHHVNAVAVDGGIWVLGGLIDSSFTATTDVYRYDPRDNIWAPRAPIRPGAERGGAMVAAIGKTVYVAGGLRGNESVNDFSVLDTERGLWKNLAPLPLARDHGAVAAFGGVFYVIGGRSTSRSIGAHTSRVDAFDPGTGAWTERTKMPTSRAGCAAAVANGQIIVMGGEGDTRRPGGVFPEVEAYDPVADTWTSLPSMKTPRHGTGAAAIGTGNIVIVPGGGIRQSLAPTDIVETLTF